MPSFVVDNTIFLLTFIRFVVDNTVSIIGDSRGVPKYGYPKIYRLNSESLKSEKQYSIVVNAMLK